jgi:hypothetical protein
MTNSRRVLVLLLVATLSAGLGGCINRSTGEGPYSTALTRLRQLGVPSRFDDALLLDLSAQACAMPAGTRAAEFEPGIFRQLAAAGIEIDAGAGALVEILFARGPALCAQTDSPSPSSAPASSSTTYADVEANLASVRTTLLEGGWLAFTGLTNAALSVPSTGIMRIDGEAPAGTEGQAQCFAVIILGSLYSFLLTPVELAVLTGDPDPVVQIAVGSVPILDSSPHGLSELSRDCFGQN